MKSAIKSEPSLQPIKILLVDDEPNLLSYVQSYLQRRKYTVDVAHDGEEGQRMAVSGAYHAIILDNIMPKKLGWQVCAAIRNVGIETPVLILSAQSDVWNKTELLNIGADDYITKPFHIEELLARLLAVLRRSGSVARQLLTTGDITLDMNGHKVTRKEREITLTKKEFQILALLMERQGNLVLRDAMVEEVWGAGSHDLAMHSLDTHMANLRKKLNNSGEEDPITTISGEGYRI
jgi:DNA-binding response OmpR family regulator